MWIRERCRNARRAAAASGAVTRCDRAGRPGVFGATSGSDLLSAEGCGRGRGIGVDLEARDLAVPEGPEVRFVHSDLPASAPYRVLDVHQGHELVSLGDELARLEHLEVQVRVERSKPRSNRLRPGERACVWKHVGRTREHPFDVLSPWAPD